MGKYIQIKTSSSSAGCITSYYRIVFLHDAHVHELGKYRDRQLKKWYNVTHLFFANFPKGEIALDCQPTHERELALTPVKIYSKLGYICINVL